MIASICMLAENGIAVIIAGDKNNIKKEQTVNYEITSYGLLLYTESIEVPVPEVLLTHLQKTGTVTIFMLAAGDYIAEPVETFKLDLVAIAEARGIYSYIQNSKKNKSAETAIELLPVPADLPSAAC